MSKVHIATMTVAGRTFTGTQQGREIINFDNGNYVGVGGPGGNGGSSGGSGGGSGGSSG